MIMKHQWASKDWNRYMKKTHNKFFFYVLEEEIPMVEKKLGMELEWSAINNFDTVPDYIRKVSICISLDQRYYAEIDKNEKNLKLLQEKFNENLSYEKDGVRTLGGNTLLK